MLNKKTERRVNKFAERAGVTPEYFLSKVANEWLDEKGDYVLGRLRQMRNAQADLGKVICIAAARRRSA